jgi:hypothetical protein
VSLTGTRAGPGLGLGLPTGGSGSATVTAGATAAYTLSVGGAGVAGNCLGVFDASTSVLIRPNWSFRERKAS